MISAHLPAGTKIECINVSVGNNWSFEGPYPELGTVYTIDGYENERFVYLAEMPELHPKLKKRFGYSVHRFRVVQLPKLPAVLLECLNARPVDKREVVEG